MANFNTNLGPPLTPKLQKSNMSLINMAYNHVLSYHEYLVLLKIIIIDDGIILTWDFYYSVHKL